MELGLVRRKEMKGCLRRLPLGPLLRPLSLSPSLSTFGAYPSNKADLLYPLLSTLQCPGCHLPFCLSHHSPFLLSSSSTYHPCTSPPPNRTPLPCPLCSTPISTSPGQDPNLSMDAHLGSSECVERGRVQGMGEAGERELRRLKRRRGEMCWVGSCRKVTKGGLGVKCEVSSPALLSFFSLCTFRERNTDSRLSCDSQQTCLHTHCLPHRNPSAHSCKPPSLPPITHTNPKPSSSKKPSSQAPSTTTSTRKTPLSLSSASTNAGLAALRRQAAEGIKGVREDGEKAVGGLKGFGQKGVAAR